MKFIEQEATNMTPVQYDLVSIKKHIERCGKVSYKSYGNITPKSYEKFFDMLIKSNHLSVLEHGTVYLTIAVGSPMSDPYYIEKMEIVHFYQGNPFSRVNEGEEYKKIEGTNDFVSLHYYYITTNMRVIIENDRLQNYDLMYNNEDNIYSDLKYIVEKPSEKHYQRITFGVMTNIGVSREFNRHRVFSITERSTRYCDYTKDKFDNEISFIRPLWMDDLTKTNEVLQKEEILFENACNFVESTYRTLLKDFGWKPEEVRDILPLCTATEVACTGYMDDWNRFFDMRMKGTTGKPQPEMRQLATLIFNELNPKSCD